MTQTGDGGQRADLPPQQTYWNHNTAYHSWVLKLARDSPGRVLDVGCGEGLLVQRLATVSADVTGIDPDAPTLARASRRCAGIPGITLCQQTFASFEAAPASYSLITFMASLHHMELAASLQRAADLLRPGGWLAVVGLAANARPGDIALAGLTLPVSRLGSWLHGETRDIGVPIAPSRLDLESIRTTARNVLPGVTIRRGLYYRYVLRWQRPQLSSG